MHGEHSKCAFITSWRSFLPSWSVPKAGSLLPASAPQESLQTPEQQPHGLSALYLCDEILPSGIWVDEKDLEVPASVWTTYMRTLAMKTKPDPRWRLKALVKCPSCFLFHALCFVCLILWLHDACGIGSEEIPQEKVKRACGVPGGAKPKKPWKHPLPARGCEISSPIARPARFGARCGRPHYEPLPGFCLLFLSAVKALAFWVDLSLFFRVIK